jgi:hypothetical protein
MLADVTLADPQDPAAMDVEVRAACGSFHDRYVVDRRTGIVTTWGDNPQRAGGPASTSLAEKLLTVARTRVLSLRESRCLALEAARSLPGWEGADGSTTIQQQGAPPFSPETYFQLRRKSLDPPVEAVALLYVNPRTGHVQDGGSATEVVSPGLGELLAKMIALKFPPLLNNQNALLIALRVPALAAVLQRKGCSLIVNSELTPEVAIIAPACDGRYLDGPKIAVDLRDGLVSDADTKKPIDAQQADLLAKNLVSTVLKTRLRLQEEVDAKCGGPEHR